MRTTNTIRNAIIGTFMQILSMVASFITRAVFARTLTVEYLGVESVFTDLISMLSIAELGFSTAIMYSLFDPIRQKNITKLNSIMSFYKRVYSIIGLTILIIGLIITPILSLIIDTIPTVEENVYVIFILFLINSVISYFYSYKQALITASQNDYIVQRVTKLFTIVSNLIQIFVLIRYKNFILFLIIKIITTFIINLYLSKVADSMFPFLNIRQAEKLPKKDLSEIKKNILAMFFHKIGYRIVFSTDNIFISIFSSISNAGKYSNYNLITNSIALLVDNVLNASSASVGDLKTENNNEKSVDIFNRIYFLNYFMYSFFTTCLLVLFNDFIFVWLGNSYSLSIFSVTLIVLNFFIHGMRRTIIIFRDTWGLFYYDRYKPLLEVISNIILQILLGYFLGLNGIIFGTSLTILLTSSWIEPYVLFKYGFRSSSIPFFKSYFTFFFKMIFVTSFVFILMKNFTVFSISNFIIKGILTVIITLILMFFTNLMNDSLHYYINLVKKILSKG